MTLRADLTALLAGAGIGDVDVDAALADGHVRSAAYQRVVAAARRRDQDRALVATILGDPDGMAAKTAVVALVDRVAPGFADPADFARWAAGLAPEIDRLAGEGHRAFLHRRIGDWTLYLAVRAGRTPGPAELAAATDWMHRTLATESTSPAVLDLLAETGRTTRIRRLARDRARRYRP